MQSVGSARKLVRRIVAAHAVAAQLRNAPAMAALQMALLCAENHPRAKPPASPEDIVV